MVVLLTSAPCLMSLSGMNRHCLPFLITVSHVRRRYICSALTGQLGWPNWDWPVGRAGIIKEALVSVALWFFLINEALKYNVASAPQESKIQYFFSQRCPPEAIARRKIFLSVTGLRGASLRGLKGGLFNAFKTTPKSQVGRIGKVQVHWARTGDSIASERPKGVRTDAKLVL
jgi:hypothetical protein